MYFACNDIKVWTEESRVRLYFNLFKSNFKLD